MDCLNLLEQFGRQYRITYDPAYDPQHRPIAKRDPWMMQIPCQRGVIYPVGGQVLAVDIDARPISAHRLLASGVCTLRQAGNRERTFTFDVADFHVVAEIVKPRRRRRLSAAQKKAAVENLKPYWNQRRRMAESTRRDL